MKVNFMIAGVRDRRNRGFSLIELMVVVAIIAILVGFGAASFTTAQKKARDSARRSEILSIGDGFEQYFSVNGNYDTNSSCNTMKADATIFPGGVPTEKITGVGPYYFSCTASTFWVCAELESDTGNADKIGTNPPSFDNSGDEDWFCVVNQQ